MNAIVKFNNGRKLNFSLTEGNFTSQQTKEYKFNIIRETINLWIKNSKQKSVKILKIKEVI